MRHCGLGLSHRRRSFQSTKALGKFAVLCLQFLEHALEIRHLLRLRGGRTARKKQQEAEQCRRSAKDEWVRTVDAMPTAHQLYYLNFCCLPASPISGNEPIPLI
jgi:hypothetical protein